MNRKSIKNRMVAKIDKSKKTNITETIESANSITNTFLTTMALPTLSSSTPLIDWFTNANQLYNTVHNLTNTIQKLHDRIVVLESRANISVSDKALTISENTKVNNTKDDNSNVIVEKKTRGRKKKNAVEAVAVEAVAAAEEAAEEAAEAAEATEASVKAKVNTNAKPVDGETKKRGRKPAEVNLSSFLREGEQIIAKIPLGDRRFDEHAITFQDGKLMLEDEQAFDHPTTMVAVLAKILEDIGERSPDCSKSLNGWMLCSVMRDGKRVTLDKLKPSTDE